MDFDIRQDLSGDDYDEEAVEIAHLRPLKTSAHLLGNHLDDVEGAHLKRLEF